MSLALQLKDYRLTTAEILYHLPDHPEILQTYVWQDLDIAPRFPVLHKFLDFWDRELDGREVLEELHVRGFVLGPGERRQDFLGGLGTDGDLERSLGRRVVESLPEA